VTLTQAKGGWLVSPAPSAATADRDAAASDRRSERPASAEARPEARPAAQAQAQAPRQHGPQQATSSAPPATRGTPADGLREFRQVLAASQVRRWPMYLRNVKQILRQAPTPFDERAFGFGSLVDLLRAAQKENIVRVDRDRQGVIRVFQGSAPPGLPIDESMPVDVEIVEAPPDIVEVNEPIEERPGLAATTETSVEVAEPVEPPAARPSRSPRARRPRPRKPAAEAPAASPGGGRTSRRRVKSA
jgi:hypothetical protein